MRRLLTAALLALLTASAGSAWAKPGAGRADSEYTWIEDNDGERVEVRVRGSVELDDDSTAIVRMTPGSSLYAEERAGGTTRSVRVRPRDGASLDYEYKVNGRTAEFDGAARSWFSTLLRRSSEEGGLNAEARAKRVLATRGPDGLLDEVGRVKGDYAKGAILDVLLAAGRPDAATSRRALQLVASGFTSDYYRQQALEKFAGASLADAETRAAYFAVVDAIESDYYRTEALGDVIDRHPRDAELLRAAVGATGKIESDYYRAQTLEKLAERAGDDGALHDAVVEAAQRIESDYYRGQVLTKLFPKRSR